MIIHIGTHKTGTTSIQQYLAKNRPQIEAAGYLYPRSGLFGDQHAALPAALMDSHPVLPESILNEDPEVVLHALRAECPPGMNVLLSSEVFWELATYLRQDFEALHARLAAYWQPVLVFLARDPHEKAWSAVKHAARRGQALEPVDAYAQDLALTQGTETFLMSTYPSCVRIEYDGHDSVRQLLRFLLDDSIIERAGTTQGQAQVLTQLAAQRRPQSKAKRRNRDFSSAHSAAVTLAISRCLADHPIGPGSDSNALPTLYSALFRVPRVSWSGCGLPGDRALHDKVRLAAATGESVFTAEQIQSIRIRLSSPSVRWRARLARREAVLDAVLDAMELHLERMLDSHPGSTHGQASPEC